MVSCRRFAVQYCPLVMGKLNLMVDNSIVLFCKLHKKIPDWQFCSLFCFPRYSLYFCTREQLPMKTANMAGVRTSQVLECVKLLMFVCDRDRRWVRGWRKGGRLCVSVPTSSWPLLGFRWSTFPSLHQCWGRDGGVWGDGDPCKACEQSPPPYQISSPTQKAGKGWRKQSWRHHSTILSPLPILSPFSDQSCLWSGDWTRLLLQYRCWKWLCVCVNWLNFEQNRKKSP